MKVNCTKIVCDFALELKKVLMTISLTLNSIISMPCSVSLLSVDFTMEKRKYFPLFLTHFICEGIIVVADDLDVARVNDDIIYNE